MKQSIIERVQGSVGSVKELTASPLENSLMSILSAINHLDFGALKGTDKEVTAVDRYVLTVDNLLHVAQDKGRPIKAGAGGISLYNGVHWEHLDPERCMAFLERVAITSGYEIINGKFYGTLEKLYKQLLTAAYAPTVPANGRYTYLNLANGTLLVSADGGVEFVGHDSKHDLRYCLDFGYDPQATCPRFEAFLNHVLPDVESRNLLQDYLGYIFVRNLKIEKVLILYGSGANGKSVVYEVVRRLLGAVNITSYSLSELTKDDRCRANIEHKLLNFASEINGEVRSDMLKRMASGEPISVRKLYQDTRETVNYPKMMFNTNNLPTFGAESTDAFLRRFAVVAFNVTIPQAERDVHLVDKICATDLPGILNWVLEGTRRVIRQKCLSACAASDEAVEAYREELNPVLAFLRERKYYRVEDSYPIALSQLYEEYKMYFDDSKKVGNKTFARELRKLGYDVKAVGGQARRVNLDRDRSQDEPQSVVCETMTI